MRGGEGDVSTRAHLDGCGPCRERVAQAREGLDLAERVGPRARAVSSLLGVVPSRGRRADRRPEGRGLAGPILATAWPGPRAGGGRGGGAGRARSGSCARPFSPVPTPGATAAGWEALPASADDGALDVLRGLALQGTGLQAATECGSVMECLGEMNDEESRDVAVALRGALPEGRS